MGGGRAGKESFKILEAARSRMGVQERVCVMVKRGG